MANANTKIRIGFSRSTKKFAPFSWLIRWFQGVPYSHVFLTWHSRGADVEVVYHAAGTKLHFLAKPIFDARAETLETFEFEINKAQYRQLINFCMSMAGVNYGFLQVLGIGIADIFKLKKNPFSQGRKSQVCSELVGYFLQDILKVPVNINLDIAGPREIHELVKQLKQDT